MSYFKDDAGNCYFLSAEDIANGGLSLLPADCVPITDEEAYIIQNPPPTPQQILASQSAKLQGFTQTANAQKTALSARISTLNDAVELEMATPAEEAEHILRTAQFKQWKTYAVLLGRVTAQAGWPSEVVWPIQPPAGMDLTVSASAPELQAI